LIGSTVWDATGILVSTDHSAAFLRNLTLEEEPWESAREGLPPESRSRRTITPVVMRRFYRQQFERRGDPKMKIDLTRMRLPPLEDGLVPLPPLSGGASYFPADHLEYVAQVNADLAARRRRRPVPRPA
jgi:hypothetical protein